MFSKGHLRFEAAVNKNLKTYVEVNKTTISLQNYGHT